MRPIKHHRAEKNGSYYKIFRGGVCIGSIPLGVLVALCEVKNSSHPKDVITQLKVIKKWAKKWGLYPNDHATLF